MQSQQCCCYGGSQDPNSWCGTIIIIIIVVAIKAWALAGQVQVVGGAASKSSQSWMCDNTIVAVVMLVVLLEETAVDVAVPVSWDSNHLQLFLPPTTAGAAACCCPPAQNATRAIDIATLVHYPIFVLPQAGSIATTAIAPPLLVQSSDHTEG